MASQGEAFDRDTLIRYRLERAVETLRDARLLLEQGGRPVRVVNRSYYAMFYAVLALLASEKLSASRHGGAIALFDRTFIQTGRLPKRLSKALHRAFEWRQFGDYRNFRQPNRQQAGEIFAQAVDFVHTVQEYFAQQGLHSK